MWKGFIIIEVLKLIYCSNTQVVDIIPLFQRISRWSHCGDYLNSIKEEEFRLDFLQSSIEMHPGITNW
jgi:hypothetical protein